MTTVIEETRRCSRCNQNVQLSRWNLKANKYHCMDCRKSYSIKRYAENKPYYKEQCDKLKKDYKLRNQLFVCKYLETHPCVDCGEDNIICLHFDHLVDKEIDIAKLLSRGPCSIDRIKAEISKCEVVCANCHAKRTSERGNHFKFRYLKNKNLTIEGRI